MSLKHIPNFVWIPIACLLWAFFAFVLLLMMMSYRTKSLEIDLLSLAIKIQYVDQQLAIAQQSVNSTMSVIDGLTRQVAQYQDSLQKPLNDQKQTMGSSETQAICMQPQFPPASITTGNEVNRPVLQQLQMQKIQLEEVSGTLNQIQKNLQLPIPKKNMKQ